MHHEGPDGHVYGGASKSRTEGRGKQWTVLSVPERPDPAPGHLTFTDNQKKEPPNSGL